MKILIVDDIEENLYMLKSLLQGYGYTVQTAMDGVEALEKASKAHFDMIISDTLMPRMDGFQLCREVKKDKKLQQIAFVFYTATYIEPKDEEFALSLGAEKFIVKPTEPDVFIKILKDVIKRHQQGALAAPKPPIEDEIIYLKEYNERLIRKLEKKMIALEKVIKDLKETEVKYRDLIDNANDAVLFIDKTRAINFVNPKFCEMTGYSFEEVRKLALEELIHPDDVDMVSGYCQKRLAGKKSPRNYELRLLTRDGRTIYIDNNASTIKHKGRIVGVLSIMRDITRRKRAEEEKAKAQAQLFQAQKLEAIGILVGGIAHDFNNMLTIIQGHTELAMLKVDESLPLHRELKQISKVTMRSASLIRQLLLFSRKQPMAFTLININKTVRDLLKMLKRLIGEDIAFDTDLQTDLWAVRGDAGNIEQVIMNLALNARDAMPEGGKLFIKTENKILGDEICRVIPEAKPGKYVCLRIEDTGTGMDKDIIPRIFEPFFSTKEAGKGTGLGLSVVYGIVKQHKGCINVSSEPGRGSTFKVCLPAFPVKLADKTEEAISLKAFQGRNERILLVEDEEGVRELVTKVLAENGYVAFTASNAKEAVEIFDRENGEFHLIFCDVVLPDQNGLQLVDQLLSRNPSLRVLLSSGYVGQKSQWHVIRERGFRFIQKPYTLTELLQAIRGAVT